MTIVTPTTITLTVIADVAGEIDHTGYGRAPIRVERAKVTYKWNGEEWEAGDTITVYGARRKKDGTPYDEVLDRSAYVKSEPWARDIVESLAPQFAPSLGTDQ